MSFRDGWAAINLEMPERIPRFEPGAADCHWELVNRVCGTSIDAKSSQEERNKGTQAFLKAWDYGIYPNALLWDGSEDIAAVRTRMGHANYTGADFDSRISCPFQTVEQVLGFEPFEAYGAKDEKHLADQFTKHIHRMNERYDDVVNTTGVYVTLVSGLLHVFGWEMLLLALGENPDAFGEVVNRWTDWIAQYYRAAAQSEAVVIYSHDDMVWTAGPFANPAWYRKYIFPNLEKLWALPRESGKKILFLCDGNYTSFLDDVAACGNHGFWFECFTDLDEVCRRFGKTHFIIGNGDSRILTFGTRREIENEVVRCINTGRDCPGYFMCMSGHIPPNVPVENALHYNEVFEKLRKR